MLSKTSGPEPSSSSHATSSSAALCPLHSYLLVVVASHEVVFEGEEGGTGAGGDADFGVDVLDVVVDGPGGDEEAGGDGLGSTGRGPGDAGPRPRACSSRPPGRVWWGGCGGRRRRGRRSESRCRAGCHACGLERAIILR
jgi:hypothetical protein